MSKSPLSPIECIAAGLYRQSLTIASREAVENLLGTLHRFLDQHPAKEPLYLILDASSLDIAYTPRARERIEALVGQIYQHDKTIRMALVLPHTMSSCTAFLNNMLRSRETPQIRHLCFARQDEALSWLQNLQRNESLPAVQGF